MHLLATAADRLLDLAFPPVCPGCRAEGDPICGGCLGDLRVHVERPPGMPLGVPVDIPPPLLQLEWVAPYNGLLRRAVHALKYEGEQRLARPLGHLLAERWGRAGQGGDLLVPVPIHRSRRRARGYDQAELVTRIAAEATGMPMASALERQRPTVPQFALGRGERRANVAGAFAVPTAARPAIAERWIVLIDDVVTTGSTLAACASALRSAGALAVSAVAVAHEH